MVVTLRTLLGLMLALVLSTSAQYQGGDLGFRWTASEPGEPTAPVAGYRIHLYTTQDGGLLPTAVIDTMIPVTSWTLSPEELQGNQFLRLSSYDVWGLESDLSLPMSLPPCRSYIYQDSRNLRDWTPKVVQVWDGGPAMVTLKKWRKYANSGQTAGMYLEVVMQGVFVHAIYYPLDQYRKRYFILPNE